MDASKSFVSKYCLPIKSNKYRRKKPTKPIVENKGTVSSGNPISNLCFSAVHIYLCHYLSTANRKMNPLRQCRHAVSGFLRQQSGVRRQGGCVVIYRPVSTVQKAS